MIEKILVPLDGSPLAEMALPYANEVAKKYGASLTVARVLFPQSIMADADAGFYNEAIRNQRSSAKIYLSNIVDELRGHPSPAVPAKNPLTRHVRRRSLDSTYHLAVLEGNNVAETLLNFVATEQVDLIVMSTHGRSGLSRWFYGSVANKILQQAPCPVYLIKSKSEASEGGMPAGNLRQAL